MARSGDANPLHTDELVARRLPFGRVAVHGIHLLERALEQISQHTQRSPHRVRCTFRHPVGIGDALTTSISVDGDMARAKVTVDVWTAADITVDLVSGTRPSRRVPDTIADDSPDAPEIHTISDLEGATGEIPTGGDDLLALTRLVGMHVPGLHSMFSSLDVEYADRATDHDTLRYRVTTADSRFSRVVLDVEGPTLRGTLTAFVRPEPVEPEIGDVRPRPNEFAGQRWLVVGGSRGLGAVAVLLLDAGGADVRFTYHRGTADAEALAARTTRGTAVQFDVDDPIDAALAGWTPTHVAYMASPPIFVAGAGAYSDALAARFRHVYVDRFLALIEALRPGQLHGVLWPSSAAVEHPPPGMAEYADAKLAGERGCAELASAHPELHVAVPRLPRLLTDQTTSYVPTEFGDAASEILAALRATSA